MQNTAKLFDTNALSLHRTRALQSGNPAWFLHELAAECVHERLQDINRKFTNPAFVGWNGDIWQKTFQQRLTVALDSDVISLNATSHDLVINGLTLHLSLIHI